MNFEMNDLAPSSKMVGSQIFVNRHDTCASIESWVRDLHAASFSCIRLFIDWTIVNPRAGTWDFSQYDACFRTAEDLGIWVIPTLMSVVPPGWKRRAKGTFGIATTLDESLWAEAMDYVGRVADQYKDSPSLHSWILWNEPSQPLARNEESLTRFQSFVKRRYQNDIERLNAIYTYPCEQFEQVGTDYRGAPAPLEHAGYAERLDWIRFTVQELNAKLMEIKSVLRQRGAQQPVHTNPHNVGMNIQSSGGSPWLQAEFTDFIGCSSHPAWHSIRFPIDKVDASVGYFADLMRSATRHPDGLFWVTELQGGLTSYSGNRISSPSEVEIRHWMWESFGSGAQAVVFWCFNMREGGFEAGEWSLLNQLGRPSRRLKAATEVANLIRQNQQLFNSMKPVRSTVYLLYSEDSMNVAAMKKFKGGDGPENPRGEQAVADALCGAYILLRDLGYDVQFVYADQLSAQQAERLAQEGACLIAPSCLAFSQQTVEALRCFVGQGGALLADGLCGYFDPDGFIARENWSTFSDIFGASIEDVYAPSYEPEKNNDEFPSWFLRCLLHTDGATVLDCYDDGVPAVTQHRFGEGTAIRFASYVFQEYLSRPNPNTRHHLQNVFEAVGIERCSFVIQDKPVDVRLRLLSSDEQMLLIVMNRGVERSLRIQSPKVSELEVLNNVGSVQQSSAQMIELTIPKDMVSVIRCRV